MPTTRVTSTYPESHGTIAASRGPFTPVGSRLSATVGGRATNFAGASQNPSKLSPEELPAGGRRRERCQGARTRATHVTPRCRKHAPLSFRCPVIMSREAGGVPGGPQTTPSSGTVGLGNGACGLVVGSKGSRRATSGCPTANLSRKGCPPGGASAVREARRPRVSVGLRSKGTQGRRAGHTSHPRYPRRCPLRGCPRAVQAATPHSNREGDTRGMVIVATELG